jgi:hypothetical protein
MLTHARNGYVWQTADEENDFLSFLVPRSLRRPPHQCWRLISVRVASKDSLRGVADDIASKHALGSDATADAFNGVQVVFTTTLVLKREVSERCRSVSSLTGPLRPQHHRQQAYIAPSRKTRAVDSGKRAKCARLRGRLRSLCVAHGARYPQAHAGPAHAGPLVARGRRRGTRAVLLRHHRALSTCLR